MSADLKLREVEEIFESRATLEGAGVRLRRSIGSQALNYLDPFLLLDEFRSDNPNDYIRGFPDHPHRGIETVTYMVQGEMRHKDSIGNAGVIGPGDAQWMSSGRGIIHSEMPAQREGTLWGYQLWVNLPAKEKMSKPRYQDIQADEIAEVEKPDGLKVRIITGEYEGNVGPVTEIDADPTYLDVTLPAHGTFEIPTKPGYTAFAYIVQGSGRFGNNSSSKVDPSHLVILGDGELFRASADEQPVRFLYVSGKPFNEPIARYGPFVMNTREEIEQTIADLRNGTFL